MVKLRDWQKRFKSSLQETSRRLKEFNTKDRMAEAELYLEELNDIGKKLEEFNEEVGAGIRLMTGGITSSYFDLHVCHTIITLQRLNYPLWINGSIVWSTFIQSLILDDVISRPGKCLKITYFFCTLYMGIKKIRMTDTKQLKRGKVHLHED